MPRIRNLIQNGVVVEQPIYNNVELTKWIHNGIVVWEKGAYEIEVINETSISNMVCTFCNRKKIGDPFQSSSYETGDTFDINGLTCTMEDNHVFSIKGKATADTRISYSIGNMELPPVLANEDTDILCYGLPIDAPDGITIEFTATSTSVDHGTGTIIDLGGTGGVIPVTISIVIREGTSLFDIKMTPTMQFLNQGWIGWIEETSRRTYACKYCRYKKLDEYIEGHIHELPIVTLWTKTMSYGSMEGGHYTIANKKGYYDTQGTSIEASYMFDWLDDDNTIEGWDFSSESEECVSPYVTAFYIVNPSTVASSAPIQMGTVDRNNYSSQSGYIRGLREFLNEHEAYVIEGTTAPSKYLEIQQRGTNNYTGYSIYNSSYTEIESGVFPSITEGVWFMGDFFILLVNINNTLNYKLVKYELDGTETEIYDFKNQYDVYFSPISNPGFGAIDYTGEYAFLTLGERGGSTRYHCVIDKKCNVYISGGTSYMTPEVIIGNLVFERDYGVGTAGIVRKLGIPLR